MYTCAVRPEIASLSAYVPGMSIAEVRERYGLSRVIKMASNENPLGVSPLVRKVLATSLEEAFRYPQGGNPALREALARAHHVSPERIVVGNGSDEIIDMLIRMLAVPGRHSVVCFEPCFSLYPIQARICGVETRRCPLSPDYSFDLDALFSLGEFYRFAQSAGLDMETLQQVVAVSAGGSTQFERNFNKMVADDYRPTFALALLRKDMSIALASAQSQGLSLPLSEEAFRLFKLAAAFDKEDCSAIAKVPAGA